MFMDSDMWISVGWQSQKRRLPSARSPPYRRSSRVVSCLGADMCCAGDATEIGDTGIKPAAVSNPPAFSLTKPTAVAGSLKFSFPPPKHARVPNSSANTAATRQMPPLFTMGAIQKNAKMTQAPAGNVRLSASPWSNFRFGNQAAAGKPQTSKTRQNNAKPTQLPARFPKQQPVISSLTTPAEKSSGKTTQQFAPGTFGDLLKKSSVGTPGRKRSPVVLSPELGSRPKKLKKAANVGE